jgi:outer membrane protein
MSKTRMPSNQFSVPLLLKSLAILAATTLSGVVLSAEPDSATRIDGDIGVAAYRTNSVVRGANDSSVLPYAYFDYGRAFARIDTFGVKTVALGAGYLEVVGRVSLEGFNGGVTGLQNIKNRSTPIPIGIGSLQETPIGNFYAYAFHDFASSGYQAEVTHVSELKLGNVTFYPMLGVEYRSAAYVRHLYGISSDEASANNIAAYSPGSSLSPNLGFMLEIPTGKDWYITTHWRRKWFDSAVTNSALTDRKTQDNAFIALTYRFK